MVWTRVGAGASKPFCWTKLDERAAADVVTGGLTGGKGDWKRVGGAPIARLRVCRSQSRFRRSDSLSSVASMALLVVRGV